jgi:hypothetical protein
MLNKFRLRYLFFITVFYLFLSEINLVNAQQVLSGDANNDGKVNGLDYNVWLTNYDPKISHSGGSTIADFNVDTFVNGVDYTIWLLNYGKTIATSTPTKAITATPTKTTTGTPTITPPQGTTKGLWISQEEIMKLPTSGAAWDRLLSAANSNWGSANLGDNNSMHDVDTLAGALVAVRTNNSTMRTKTIDGLQSAMVSPLTRALELSRGLQTYIIAADIISYHDSAFESWVRKMLNADVSPHTGGTDLCNSSGTSFSCSGIGGVICTAHRSANNWGGHARASTIAGALYLNDQTLLNQVANSYRAFIGLNAPNHLYCENTTWHANPNERFGVNRIGTTIQGHSVSGVLPEDWRRASEFQWPPLISSTDAGYMWEGMQGYIVSAVLLHRAGIVPITSGDNAVVRSMDILYAVNYPPSGDDTWIPWVVNHYAGKSYPTSTASPGKNMGWTDWMYQ